MIPESITHLTFGCYFNQPLSIGVIPNSVTHLNFGYDFNQALSIGVIPENVIHLTFGYSFNQPLSVGVIPNSVTHLTFVHSFNQPLSIGVIPESVTHLTFGDSFNQPLSVGVIPESVTHLTFLGDFNQPVILPESVLFLNNKPIFRVKNLEKKQILEKIEDCVICLESNSSIITSCNHIYCTSCFEDWYRKNYSCAYCRKKLYNNDLFLIQKE